MQFHLVAFAHELELAVIYFGCALGVTLPALCLG